MAVWVCPACKRRVPGYASKCHCGAERPEAAALVQAPAAAGPPQAFGGQDYARFKLDFPWPVWVALGVVLLALAVGVVNLFRPVQRERIVPVLGQLDPTPPPSPAKTRR